MGLPRKGQQRCMYANFHRNLLRSSANAFRGKRYGPGCRYCAGLIYAGTKQVYLMRLALWHFGLEGT